MHAWEMEQMVEPVQCCACRVSPQLSVGPIWGICLRGFRRFMGPTMTARFDTHSVHYSSLPNKMHNYFCFIVEVLQIPMHFILYNVDVNPYYFSLSIHSMGESIVFISHRNSYIIFININHV